MAFFRLLESIRPILPEAVCGQVMLIGKQYICGIQAGNK